MTLKQISTSQVELGMFIHGFQGSWLSHPFWRARFLVTDEEKLQALRDSALDAIVIDTERGIDVVTRGEAPPPRGPAAPPETRARIQRREPAAAARPAPLAAPFPAQRPGSVAIVREFGNARHAAGQARKVISRIFLEARLGKAPRVTEVAPVVEDIHASIERNPHAFSGLMRCKTEIEAIYQHMLSVSALMVSLARQMKLSPQEVRLAGMAGLLLDIGVSRLELDAAKLARRLDAIEPELWHRHCYVGREMLAAADGMPDEVLHAVARHHELMNGSGFPQKLAGREIDIYSRMAAICDQFDLIVCGAMTGRTVDPAEALRMMMRMEGAFDDAILAGFREALGVYPVGSFVMLRSGRIAMVVDQDPSDPALPTVRAFYSAATGKHVAAKTIVLAHCYGEDAIAGVADMAGLDLPAPEDLRERLFAAAAK
ncbi:HD-GYP domain, c-di-GMP phosphodiesterase class II (or its inactivated variant) [Novosphingobium sp. CF614]|uniref:HD-GYP domain-containing protein n=1 Tax=Novosphingobium sp. CF614 TaxID=1884364 RepID=UPI0008E6445F|nr:HD-GYP domain-containing protein [Novosphingobium sp. CF614]SFF95788.1 HD-GYP domain, c-di-GMP phosphodiesterase class II (or its inactivated variant) [Novosphingobium sp. CF614]